MTTRNPLVLVTALALAACAAEKNFDLTVVADRSLNPNKGSRDSTSVPIRVLRLKGPEAAQAFETAQFDDVWGSPETEPGQPAGRPQTFDISPGQRRVIEILKVAPDVTHLGVLALFEELVPGKERVLLPRAEIESVEVVLKDYEIRKTEN